MRSVFLLCALVACTSDPSTAGDAGPRPDAERDAAASHRDAAPSPGDAASSASDAAPSASDAAPSAGDAGVGGPIQAVLDQRCDYFERAGILTVTDPGIGVRYLSLGLYDRPLPWFGPPTLTSNDCVYFQAMDGCPCGAGLVCNYQGQCVAEPLIVPAVRVVVSAPGGTRELMGDGQSLGGEIDLPDPAIALRVEVGGFVVEVPPMSLPPALTRPMGIITGDESMPQAVDLSWAPAATGGFVYAHINMNHHVRLPSFTECVVPIAQGSIHIDAAMLTPLSVSTGLEFQGLEHIRYAKADTPLGCFEVRFTRQEFVSLMPR